jgi:MscS family membrane protein
MAAWRDAGAPAAARSRARAEAIAAFDMSGLPEEGRAPVATRMLEILNRIGRIPTSDLPDLERVERDGLRSFTLFPSRLLSGLEGYSAVSREAPQGSRIVLAPGEDGAWRFTAGTVEQLDTLHRAVEDLAPTHGEGTIALTPDRVIRSYMPPELRRGELFKVEYWQWLGLAVLIFVGLTLDVVVRVVIRKIWRRVIQRRGGEADRELLKKSVRPFGLLAAALWFYWTVRLLGLPPIALMVVLVAVRTFLMLASVWAAFRITDLAGEFFASKASRTDTRFDDLLVPLLRKTAKVFIAAMGVIYIAQALSIEILPLLTGLGIGGLAFAFAAKDTIENFFGSVAVILDRPFEVGDWVVIGDVEGTVEELGFRSTRVRTFYKSLVTVPNSMLVRATVDNYGRREVRRVKTMLSLTYDTPPEKIEAFCEGVRELIRLHPYTWKDSYHVYFNQFSASSLDVLLYMFLECPDWATELRERQRLFLDILRLADRLGVSFAFPTQTLHLLREDPDRAHEPAEFPSKGTETRAMREGIRAAKAVTSEAEWRVGRPAPVSIQRGPSEAWEDEGPVDAGGEST